MRWYKIVHLSLYALQMNHFKIQYSFGKKKQTHIVRHVQIRVNKWIKKAWNDRLQKFNFGCHYWIINSASNEKKKSEALALTSKHMRYEKKNSWGSRCSNNNKTLKSFRECSMTNTRSSKRCRYILSSSSDEFHNIRQYAYNADRVVHAHTLTSDHAPSRW